MAKKWQYGKDPNPSSWHEAAQIIKANGTKKAKPPNVQPTPVK